jgi:hypothetical protein
MKIFLKNSITYLFPILVLGIISEILLRNIPNDYSLKKAYLDRNARNIEVLYLGNSHVLYGINPKYSKYKSYNTAYVSQSLDFDLAILNKYKNKWKNLNCIVLPIDYLTFNLKLEKSLEAWRIKNYALYFNIHKNDFYNLEIVQNKLEVNIIRLKEYYINKESITTVNNLGYATNYTFFNKQNLQTSGEVSSKRHIAIGSEYFEENLLHFKAILNFAEQRKVKVLLVSLPAHKTYTERLNNNILMKSINIAKASSIENKNVFFKDFMNDTSFLQNDFYDADHLNEIESKKLTKIMDSILAELK